jgi:hypothetical protein
MSRNLRDRSAAVPHEQVVSHLAPLAPQNTSADGLLLQDRSLSPTSRLRPNPRYRPLSRTPTGRRADKNARRAFILTFCGLLFGLVFGIFSILSWAVSRNAYNAAQIANQIALLEYCSPNVSFDTCVVITAHLGLNYSKQNITTEAIASACDNLNKNAPSLVSSISNAIIGPRPTSTDAPVPKPKASLSTGTIVGIVLAVTSTLATIAAGIVVCLR